MRRRLIYCMVLLAMPFFSFASAATDEFIKTKTAYIFQKNSAQSFRLFQLRRGERVEILGVADSMSQVRFNFDGRFSITGWVLTESINSPR